MMVFMMCESFDYDFEVTIFPKDYETFKDKIDEHKIIIVNGGLNLNMEYKRKAILARDIKSLSLTQVREQAQSL
jgi:DNA polymerase III alpha subunit